MLQSSICIFAHNEEREIEECLDCLVSETAGMNAEVHIIVNGSTDRMAEIARHYASDKPIFHVHDLAEGDKANAWNYFVYEASGEAEVYVFHDGDCQMRPGAVEALSADLRNRGDANVASGFPATGRSKERWCRDLAQNHDLPGNLYALSGDFIQRLKKSNLRFPYGLFGEDGFIGVVAQWDLDPTIEGVKERVVPCPDAEFTFNPMSLFSWWSWRLFYKRLIRYSIRRYQILMMKEPLKTEGIASLKPHVRDLYRERLHLCELKWRGLVLTNIDWIALRRMRRIADAG
jgi:glycosyltransferase involved in cell wall biosynthesis